MSKSKTKSEQYGIYYRSHGKWAGPYRGITASNYMFSRNPLKASVRHIANNVLRSRVKIKPVAS